jgi:uncharacterized protein YeaC (DUF1315 family)
MDLQQLLNSITPEIYQNLKVAVELGKWADGNKLSREQRQLCMQAVIAYEHKHLPPEEHTGYIPPEPHTFCGDEDDHNHGQPEQEKPIKWVE